MPCQHGSEPENMCNLCHCGQETNNVSIKSILFKRKKEKTENFHKEDKRRRVMKKLVLFMILIITIVTGGSIMLHVRGLNGGDIAVVWFLILVGIVALLDLIYLIIMPMIKIVKGKDDRPPEFNNRAFPVFRV